MKKVINKFTFLLFMLYYKCSQKTGKDIKKRKSGNSSFSLFWVTGKDINLMKCSFY